MRILLIAPRFHTNQASFVEKLVSEGHTVDFFVIWKLVGENYNCVEPKLIEVSKLTSYYLKYVLRRKEIDAAVYSIIAIPKIFRFVKMIRKFNPDVIILRGASAPRYSWIALLYSFFFKVKIVFYTQGPKHVESISLLRVIHDWVFIKLLKIKWFTPVLFRGTGISANKNLEYITYIPFFTYLNDGHGQCEAIEKPEKLNFLCVAKYESRKNLDILIEVFSIISREYNNFKLTIIGSVGTKKRLAYYWELKNIISEKALMSNVDLLVDIPYSEMGKYYSENDVFIMPSMNESASVSQLEAMSYGLAIICSEDNGTAHYIVNGENGYVIKPDKYHLLKFIKVYLQQPELARLHGEKSLLLVKSQFSIDKSYIDFMKLIGE